MCWRYYVDLILVEFGFRFQNQGTFLENILFCQWINVKQTKLDL